MAASNFDACMAIVFGFEGGFVDNPKDPGGPTNLGITQRVLAAHRGHPVSVEDVRDLTRPEAEGIYRLNYWDAIRGDDLPIGVDLVVFDFAVNSGVSRGAMALQETVGVRADGHIGALTLDAVAANAPDFEINGECARRMEFVRSLKTFREFGRGWMRRVEEGRAKALAMAAEQPHDDLALSADASPHPDPHDVNPRKLKSGRAVWAMGIGLSGSALSSFADQAKDAAGSLVAYSDAPLVRHICLLLTGVGFIAGALALVDRATKNEGLFG